MMDFINFIVGLFRRKPRPAPVPPHVGGTDRLVALINQYRSAHGMPALAENHDLDMAATWHAIAMANSGVMAHRVQGEPSLDGRLVAAGYQCQAEGECIASGQESADQVLAKWASDMPHRMILLGDYREVGVGRRGNYWCADLATPE